MTIIRSNPRDETEIYEEVEGIGNGPITLNVTEAQLELISTFVYYTRLGQSSPYSVAAFELLNAINEVMGSDFMDEAATLVNLNITIEDDTGVIMDTRTVDCGITIEV